MSKKILIPLIVIIVAALLGATAYFVIIPRIKAGQSGGDQRSSSNTEQTSQSQTTEGKPAASGQDAMSVGNMAGSSGVIDDSNYMFSADEEKFVEEFVLGIFKDSGTKSYQMLSSEIPTMFNTDTNSINGILAAGSFASFYNLGFSTGAQINYCSVVREISDQYDRHIALVTAQNGNNSESYQMSIVVDLLNHSMVFFNMEKINPVHNEMVEKEYQEVVDRLYVVDNSPEMQQAKESISDLVDDSWPDPLTGDNYLKGSLMILYSYSPFIEEEYWVAVSDHYSFESHDANIRQDDIAYRLFSDWRPTYDGSALTVENIGQPNMLNSSGTTAYYECPIAYRTNHGGNAQETYTTATLHFYVNLNTMVITGLTEDNVNKVVIDPVSSGQAPTPSMKSLLGIQ